MTLRTASREGNSDSDMRPYNAARVSFQINTEALPLLEASPYLGMKIAYNNSDWVAVYLNLRKAWRRWGMIARFLERTGKLVRDRGEIYKVVTQSLLLYGSKILVVTREMLRVLKDFHHWEVQRIMGMTAKRGAGKEWEYPAVEEVMESVGLHPIGVYIKRLRTTMDDRVAFREVYTFCTEAEIMPGTIRMVRWWD